MTRSTRVARSLLFLSIAAAWVGARAQVDTSTAAAATVVLESSALRVEVTAAPYSYAVIEKSTGQVLVRQSETTFTVRTARSASAAAIGKKSGTTLDATLKFEGSTDTAHVRWTFVDQAVLQVELTCDEASSTNITEAFLDQGEHYYGLWEYSYYGTGGALDNRGANNQPLLGLSGPPVGSGDPSGRAPFYVTSRKYGVYADTLATGRATIAVNDRTSVTFDTPKLTYYVIYGPTYAQVLARYNKLAGGSLMPPLWAFDSIWWRDDHHADFTANGVTNAQELVKKDADNLQRLQIPASAIWLDRPFGSGGGGLGGWGNFDFDAGPTGFPNPDEMIRDLATRNMYLLGWIANRANNSMLTDPTFAPGTFNAANAFAGNFTTTPRLDLRRPEVFAHFRHRKGGGDDDRLDVEHDGELAGRRPWTQWCARGPQRRSLFVGMTEPPDVGEGGLSARCRQSGDDHPAARRNFGPDPPLKHRMSASGYRLEGAFTAGFPALSPSAPESSSEPG